MNSKTHPKEICKKKTLSINSEDKIQKSIEKKKVGNKQKRKTHNIFSKSDQKQKKKTKKTTHRKNYVSIR